MSSSAFSLSVISITAFFLQSQQYACCSSSLLTLLFKKTVSCSKDICLSCSCACKSYQRSKMLPHSLHLTGNTHLSLAMLKKEHAYLNIHNAEQQLLFSPIKFIYQIPQELHILTPKKQKEF